MQAHADGDAHPVRAFQVLPKRSPMKRILMLGIDAQGYQDDQHDQAKNYVVLLQAISIPLCCRGVFSIL